MHEEQLGLWQNRLPECPFTGLLEEDDNHCLSFGESKEENEVLTCNSPKACQFMAHVRGVGFMDVIAKPTPSVNLPHFIPTIPHGSQKLLAGNKLPFVATSINEIVSSKKLFVTNKIRTTLGIDSKSKIILLSYALDELIEGIWPKRRSIFENIASLGLELATAVNYSIWFNEPHAERLINLKRSLITFEDMQRLDIPTIPHIYWFGRKDLCRWKDWLSENKSVSIVAINLQTERNTWTRTVEDLKFFVSKLDKPLHFLITGPSTVKRIKQLKKVLPSFSLSNGKCALKAWHSRLIKEVNGKLKEEYSNLPKNEIFRENIRFYEKLVSEK